MFKILKTATALLATACLGGFFTTARAEAPKAITIPPGELNAALETLVQQTGIQLLYDLKQVEGLRTEGVSGAQTPQAAVSALLKGTALTTKTDQSGAILISAINRPVKTSAYSSQITDLRWVQSDSPANVQNQDSPQQSSEAEKSKETNSSTSEDVEEDKLTEVLVTGTHIRGIAPQSSHTIVYDRDAIESSGIQSTERFLRSIPQHFGGLDGQGDVPLIAGQSDNSVNGASVNLRGLGPNATLTLLNGRRLAPAGFNGGFTDISAIPLSLVDRIEILTDGASAIYGGDAVAGVVNFVLRDEFTGAETQANFGAVTEGSLTEERATQTLGSAWGSGNVMGSFEYYSRDSLEATEKKFAAGAPALSTLFPAQRHRIATLVANQSIGENVRANVNAFYGARDSHSVENLGFDGAPIVKSVNGAWQLLVSPGLNADLPRGWHLDLSGTYSKNHNRSRGIALNDFPDYNSLVEYDAAIKSANLIVDGALANLPAGAMRLAIGGEARSEDLSNEDGAGIRQLSIDRNVSAAFAEVFVPIVGAENSRPGLRSLELSLAGRYDHYDDFGSSFNPKFGLRYSPIEGLSLRGTYGTSFNPPNLGNLARRTGILILIDLPDASAPGGTAPSGFILGNNPELVAEESTNVSFGLDFDKHLAAGEFSASLSYFDIDYRDLFSEIPFPGDSFLNLIDRRDELPSFSVIEGPSQPDVDNAVRLVNDLGLGTIVDLTELGGLVNPDGSVDGAPLQYLFDLRSTNVSRALNRGIDFSLAWQRATGWGNLSLGLNGVYIIDYVRQVSKSSPSLELVDTIHYPSDLKMRTNLGLSRGPWSGALFVNYTDDYFDERDQTQRRRVDSWVTLDLSLRYSFAQGSGLLSGADVSIGATNLFDRDPPRVLDDRAFNSFISTAKYDRANADPMGRFVYLELRKKWGGS